MRLSYHQNVHYNAIVDPARPTFGVGLGYRDIAGGVSVRVFVEMASVRIFVKMAFVRVFVKVGEDGEWQGVCEGDDCWGVSEDDDGCYDRVWCDVMSEVWMIFMITML